MCVIIAGTALVSGCTSSTSRTASGQGSTGTPNLTSSTPSDSPSDTVTAPTDSASSTPSSTTRSTSAAPHSSGVALPADNCPTSQLQVRVLLASGAQQQEFAEITFTNTGTTECSLTGYPGVSMRRASAALGAPALPNTAVSASTVHLAPGATAQTMLTDFSSCQAPLSDTVRVYPPNS